MIYKTLGKTGLKVSVIGFGASPLGGEFGSVDEEECRRAVDRRYLVGVRIRNVVYL